MQPYSCTITKILWVDEKKLCLQCTLTFVLTILIFTGMVTEFWPKIPQEMVSEWSQNKREYHHAASSPNDYAVS